MNHFIKIILFSSLICFAVGKVKAQTSKLVAECTITYSVNTDGKNDKEETIKKLYIKGRKIRTEINNNTFYQAIIFDNKSGEAVVLKDVGGDKYISSFTAEEWREKNKRWDSSTITLTDETKKILTYNCRKATITIKDKSTYIVYYTTDLVASATENPYEFRNIPGLVLEYDSQTDNGRNIQFKAIDINFDPVPAAKFIAPTTGYRIL